MGVRRIDVDFEEQENQNPGAARIPPKPSSSYNASIPRLHRTADGAGKVLRLRGVTVEFPFIPYNCQKLYMERLIQAIQQQDNALLESPTGTGKTLCLLCAALGWRREEIRIQRLEEMQKEAASGNLTVFHQDHPDRHRGVPRIIYASRTHSQLKQVVKELKQTVYEPRMLVLGSRPQMCVNPNVKNEFPSVQNSKCRLVVKQAKCSFYRPAAAETPPLFSEIMDLEDFVQDGLKNRVCPYYSASRHHDVADMILLPYNYLTDANTLNQLDLVLKDAIVIFDEAHNLASSCNDAASFELTTADLAGVITELQSCAKLLEDDVESEEEEEENASSADKSKSKSKFKAEVKSTGLMAIGDVLSGGVKIKVSDIVRALEVPISFEKGLEKVQAEMKNGEGVSKPGSFVYKLFGDAGIDTAKQAENYRQVLQSVEMVLLSASDGGSRGVGARCKKFGDCIRKLYVDSKKQRMLTSYRVYIHHTKAKGGTRGVYGEQRGLTLSFWCFNAGVAMSMLREHNVRSFVLTSGTLSPMESFESEMDMPFPVRVENGHVVDANQVQVQVIKTGPSGVSLNSSYRCRKDPKYVADLGQTILSFCRVVPGGVLVFFPSYGVMSTCLDAWRVTPLSGRGQPIISRIADLKEVCVEPRTSSELRAVMETYYRAIQRPGSRGSIFFAVCRGKVSEGLDFSDWNGRGVIVTGIPYPNIADPRVTLKRKYMDERKKENPGGRASGKKNVGTVATLGGDEWYVQQATRAVNQAIGRVIRHKGDFGAILLCDERFGSGSSQNNLSAWLKPYLYIPNGFGEGLGRVRHFFQNASVNPQLMHRGKDDWDETALFGGLIEEVDENAGLGTVSSFGEATMQIQRYQQKAKEERIRAEKAKREAFLKAAEKSEASKNRVLARKRDTEQRARELMDHERPSLLSRLNRFRNPQQEMEPVPVPSGVNAAPSLSALLMGEKAEKQPVVKQPVVKQPESASRLIDRQSKSFNAGHSSMASKRKSMSLADMMKRSRPKTNQFVPPKSSSSISLLSTDQPKVDPDLRGKAVAYIKKVKSLLAKTEYRMFSQQLKAYRTKQIDISSMIETARTLFREHPALLSEFAIFLPKQQRHLLR